METSLKDYLSRKKEDNSYEDRSSNIDNSVFIDMICDESLHIIF